MIYVISLTVKKMRPCKKKLVKKENEDKEGNTLSNFFYLDDLHLSHNLYIKNWYGTSESRYLDKNVSYHYFSNLIHFADQFILWNV